MHGKRPTLSTLHGIVAAAHPLAAQAGARILANGGTAFDAAAATAAALNVVEPYMSCLAGQGVATMWVAKEKRVRVLDFVPPVPKAFPVERLSNREQLARGALSVGTPGNFAGWCELVRVYGKKKLPEILAPAVALARDGFPLAEFGVDQINEQSPILAAFKDIYPQWASTYAPRGKAVKLGQILRQPDLAKTLEALGKHGPDHLYRGPLGKKIVAHLAKLGGILSMQDLAKAQPVWREPLSVKYRDIKVYAPPPPNEAFQCLLTLLLIDGRGVGAMERNGVEHLDLVFRAIRLAAGIRIAHNRASRAQVAQLLKPKAIAPLIARLTDGKPIIGPTEQWMPQKAEDPGHTTSFSIADKYGNLICLTQSLGSPFGSGVVVPGTGLCLNNFLYWTDVQHDSPNRTEPGGILPICMAPTISLKKGKPVLALGTPGSYGILQTQVQALVQYLDFGLPLQEAIEAPRARLWDGQFVQVENRLPAATLAALAERGHKIEAFDVGWTMKVGGMQAVAIDPVTGAMTGAADPRRDSYVALA